MAPKKEEPKDQVGTRKGFSRYQWEFMSSNKEFWVMGHAEVKILSMGCLLGAIVYFKANPVNPALILLLTMELFIFLFFVVINTFAIQRYLSFILWPVSDLINDLCCFGFLVGGIVFAVTSREEMPMEYVIAVGLTGAAAFFAVIDICLQRKHFSKKGPPIVPPEPKK